MNKNRTRLFCRPVLGLAFLILVLGSCGKQSGDVPGHVMNLELTGWGDGCCVNVTWDEPVFGSVVIDGYRVYFKPVDATRFSVIADSVSDMYYQHDPYDMQSHVFATGWYCVVAFNDDGESEAVDTATTIPVHEFRTVVSELHAGQSGFGWSRDSFTTHVAFMHYASNADSVDFYISDLQSGSSAIDHYLVSPHYNDSIPADSAGIPEAPWRVTGLYYTGSTYPSIAAYIEFESQVMIYEGSYYIVSTEDGYFGVIFISSIDVGLSRVEIESWFQSVRNCALLMKD